MVPTSTLSPDPPPHAPSQTWPPQIENLASYTKEWGSPRAIPELALPGPNPFVPENLSVIVPKGKVLKAGEKVEPPKVVENLSQAGVWQVRCPIDAVSQGGRRNR